MGSELVRSGSKLTVTPLCDGVRMSEHTLEDDPMAWSLYASCDTADPDLFFPGPRADTSYARSVCRACPVRRQCLDYALESKQKFGIWGGMTEAQRRRIRRGDITANHPARPRVADRVEPVAVSRPRLYLVT